MRVAPGLRRRPGVGQRRSPALRVTAGWEQARISAIVRETLLAGGQACRPLIAREGLSAVLVEPAIKLFRDETAREGQIELAEETC